jgi:hypothetical protein
MSAERRLSPIIWPSRTSDEVDEVGAVCGTVIACVSMESFVDDEGVILDGKWSYF